MNRLRVSEASTLEGADAIVIFVLAGLSIATFLLYILRNPIASILPTWLELFAKEEPKSDGLPKKKRWLVWTTLLSFLCIAGLALSIPPIILEPEHFIGIFEIVPWLSATLITAFERPTKTPRFLLMQYTFILFATLIIYSFHFLGEAPVIMDPFRLARLLVCAVSILVVGNMPIRDPSWDVSDIGSTKLAPSYHVRSPEDNLSLFQFWSMSWVWPLAKLCRSREITVEDVWQLPIEFQHTRLYMAFRELKGKLLACLIEANGLDLSIAITLAIVEKVSEVSNIRLTSQLYSALDQSRSSEALFWSLVMLSVDLVRQLSKTTWSWYARKSYERSRGETFIALFLKLLTRAVPGSDVTEKGLNEEPDDELPENTGKAKRFFIRWFRLRKKKASVPLLKGSPASNAKVVNLVRGDTYEISQRFWDFPKLVAEPIKAIFTMYYLVDIMGWPSSVGFGLMIIFLFINTMLVRQLIKLERQRTVLSDKRAQAVSHFVEANRALKLNGWTSYWSDRILKFRDSEMRKRLQLALVSASIGTVSNIGGLGYPLASICLYTLVLQRGLPSDVIWPSLQLFSHLEGSVRQTFMYVSFFWKTTIPIERVHKYMSEPDRDAEPVGSGDVKDITFHEASFSWPSTDRLVLERVNVKFTRGLTIVRGKVGAGKSSLLLAALNEMELHSGVLLRPNEAVAYVQQLPWLQNRTVRENILFHSGFDAERYRQVIHACALAPDLAAFSNGDQFKLEEGGVGLSGGQKARVALARAVYSRCRILLLDDPLAALDHDTASAIVRRLLQGPLAEGRTIVLVTHRDDLVLRIADQVVDVEAGKTRILSIEEIQEELEHPYHQSTATGSHEDHVLHGEHGDDVPSLQEGPEDPSETGGVSMTVYTKYMKAGGWHLWIALGVLYGVSRYCDIGRARLLEAWGNDAAAGSGGSDRGYWGLPEPGRHPIPWLYVLGALSGAQVVTYAMAQVLLARISINAARGLFKTAIERIGKATFRYYDITPTGQLKNRLIADMGMVDGGILAPLEQFVFHLIALVMSLVAITSQQPGLLAILLAVAVLFVYFFRIYVPVSRCLRRLEMRYLTPIISNIGVMQDGLVTIRAMRVETTFRDRHLSAVDDFQKQDHFFWSVAFWLDFRLSLSSATMRAVLIIFMVWWGASAGAIGFVLTQTIIAMTSVQQLCETFATLQLDAVSLERVNMLNRIPEEPNGDEDPPEDWPRPHDDVIFKDLCFRYDDDLPAVLDKVSFSIPGGSTCAVLGRTGSGKSTVANALLATQTPSSGSVKIGGVDLSRVDRTTLRNRVTFIQQDPILFPGTLRDNLDPQGKFSNAACENAIHRVLGPDWSLDSQIDAAGKNLSQGQRQLVSIGRAVLRRSGLVILDEATASIDRGTAAMVQRVLREELSHSTVITIAHRLEAVEDATWCLRLDQGHVVESVPVRGINGGAKAPKGR